MRTTVLLALFLLGIPALHAQEAAEAWSLKKCVEYALENNLQIQQNQLNVNSSEEALKLAEHARYPNLNGFASHNYNWGRSFDVFTNAPVTQRVQSNGFGLSSNVTVYNGFSITNRIKQSGLDLEATKYDADKAKNDMVLNVASAYLQILFSQENLANANFQVASLKQQIERTQQLVQAGVLPESNLLNLQSQQATNELQVVQAQNTLNFSKLQLRQLLQLPADSPFAIETPELEEPNASSLIPSSQQVYGTAEDIMPEVRSADTRVESAQLGIEIAKAGFQPSLSFSAGINTFYSGAQTVRVADFEIQQRQQSLGTVSIPGIDTPIPLVVTADVQVPIYEDFTFFNQLKESLRQSIGFSLNIPIYNRNQVQNSVARAQIATERARLTARITRNTLRQTIEQAYQDAIAAAQTYESNKKQVQALEETFRTTQERFNLGVSNFTDFTIAQNNLNGAKANLIRAKYDFIFKRKILDFYMGKTIQLD